MRFDDVAAPCVRCRVCPSATIGHDGRPYCGRCYPHVLLSEAHRRLASVLRRVRRNADLAYGHGAALDVREALAILGAFWSAELLDAAEAVRLEMER